MRVAARAVGAAARVATHNQRPMPLRAVAGVTRPSAVHRALLFAPPRVTSVASLTGARCFASAAGETGSNLADFTAIDIDGNGVALSQYVGKVVLVVNVASQ